VDPTESLPSSSAAVSDPPIVIPLKETGKQTGDWTLTLYPSHLALADAPGARPYVILPERAKKPGTFIEGLRAFSVEQPRKIIFKMSKEGAQALADWIGKPYLAARYLKGRYGWVSLWAFLSLAIVLGELFPSQRSGVAPHFDFKLFTLGVVLLIATAFAKWKPHAVLFLIDSLLFLSLGINLTIEVIFGRSKGWLVLAALLGWAAVNGFGHYRRFRGVKIEPLRK